MVVQFVTGFKICSCWDVLGRSDSISQMQSSESTNCSDEISDLECSPERHLIPLMPCYIPVPYKVCSPNPLYLVFVFSTTSIYI